MRWAARVVQMTSEQRLTHDTRTDRRVQTMNPSHTCASQHSHSTSKTRALAQRSAWQCTVRRAGGESSARLMPSSILASWRLFACPMEAEA